MRSLGSLLLAKCFSNSNTAPAHPHATEVAVYPALFFKLLEACLSKSVRVLAYFHNEIFSNLPSLIGHEFFMAGPILLHKEKKGAS